MSLYKQDPYDYHFSDRVKAVLDRESRTQKAKKIITIIQEFYPHNLSQLDVLDIGCSGGIITAFLGDYFRAVIGIDIDEKAISLARQNPHSDNVKFQLGDAMNLPFRDASFDVVICHHIYEHVPDAKRLMGEIYRVLKPNGFCYFGAGNKFNIMEGHYHLPFLSWLPKSIANCYVRITGKGTYYYENHLSLWKLKDLVKNFRIIDFTLKVIYDPVKYHVSDVMNENSLSTKIFQKMAKGFYFFIPSYNWVLKKR